MKMKRLQTILAGMLMLSCVVPQAVRAQEPVKQSEENMKWFADAKLGIFIHWGIYAVNGVSESWSFFNKYLPYDEYMAQCRDLLPPITTPRHG